MKKTFFIFLLVVVAGAVFTAYHAVTRYLNDNKVLKQVISRLEADTRVAQVLVTKVEYNPKEQKNQTTIKFVEFDHQGRAQEPRYFTFSGNIIQFQALVIRFDDKFVRYGDKLKGKSAYIFWKVFMLDGKNTQEYEINRAFAVPYGYQIEGTAGAFEQKLWSRFWQYALDEKTAQSGGVKNAQIEAPGTIFVPGTLYTIKIEHDGGLRIDNLKIPEILRGEQIP